MRRQLIRRRMTKYKTLLYHICRTATPPTHHSRTRTSELRTASTARCQLWNRQLQLRYSARTCVPVIARFLDSLTTLPPPPQLTHMLLRWRLEYPVAIEYTHTCSRTPINKLWFPCPACLPAVLKHIANQPNSSASVDRSTRLVKSRPNQISNSYQRLTRYDKPSLREAAGRERPRAAVFAACWCDAVKR